MKIEIIEIENILAIENQQSKNWLFAPINIEKPTNKTDQ